MRLLIAEDETDLAEALAAFFEKNRFTVDTVNDGLSAYEYAGADDYDAIILDVMMPKMDGIEVLRRIRADGNKTPVMMLTAKAEKNDRITGFDTGADDYLPKPFDTDELLSRLRAILRRREESKPPVLSYADITLNPVSDMLQLLRAPNTVFSAEKIMERVWGWDSESEINVVWVHISNLRKKLKSIGSSVTIHANRGLGYILEAEND